MKIKIPLLRALFFGILALSRAAGAESRYAAVDLGAVTPQNAIPYAINDSSQIVLGWGVSPLETRGYLWSEGAVSRLPGLPGGSKVMPFAINSQGVVAGSASAVTGASHAFIFKQGMIQDLGPGYGFGINETSQVVGFRTDARGTHAMLWDGNGQSPPRELGNLGGSVSEARAINSSGLVVGWADLRGLPGSHAFRWTQGEGIRDLGTLGGSSSFAESVNSIGTIVGWSYLRPQSRAKRAFVVREGVMVDLGALAGGDSIARGINDAGQIVGESDGRAFVTDPGVAMDRMREVGASVDGAPGWAFRAAYAINASGAITALATKRGEAHAFLLVP